MPRKLTLKLTKRDDGRVCKRIDGVLRIWPDAESARSELLELIRRRDSGMGESAPVPHDPPLRVIANRFIRDRNSRGLKPGSCRDYFIAVDEFVSAVGAKPPASDLRPADFAKARKQWSGLGPWKLANRIQCVRTMFNWACDTARLIDRLPWYGDEFHKPATAETRRVARENNDKRGERVFSKGEISKMLASPLCKGPLKAFILLGLNGGMYAVDCASLRRNDIKQAGKLRYIDNDREKTEIRRKFVLWPETSEAIDAAANGRDILFVTAQGNRWVREKIHRDSRGLIENATPIDSINLLFGRLLRAAGIKRSGVGFGALKHTHISAVSVHQDINAARRVRGHEIEGIERHYDFPDLARLKAITDLARSKLLTKVRHRHSAKQRTPSRRRVPGESKPASQHA